MSREASTGVKRGLFYVNGCDVLYIHGSGDLENEIWRMHMQICMYACIACMHRVCMYAYMYVRMYVRMHVCTYACMDVWMYVRPHVYACMHA